MILTPALRSFATTLAVAGLVFWMMPPTQPKVIQRPSWRSSIKPVKPPSLTVQAISAPWWRANDQAAAWDERSLGEPDASREADRPGDAEIATESEDLPEPSDRPAIGNLKVVAIEGSSARLFSN